MKALKSVAVLIGIITAVFGLSALVGLTEVGQSTAARRGIELIDSRVGLPAILIGIFLYWWGSRNEQG